MDYVETAESLHLDGGHLQEQRPRGDDISLGMPDLIHLELLVQKQASWPKDRSTSCVEALPFEGDVCDVNVEGRD